MLSLVLAAGLVLGWIGERIVESPTARAALSGVGLAAVLGVIVARALRARDRNRPAVEVDRILLGLHLLVVVALALYALTSDLFTLATGASLESSSPRLAGALAALWPAVLVTALFPTLLVELSFAAMARSPRLEDGRVREALYAGLGLASVLVFAFSMQYVATRRDVKADLSYFRVARPGDATRKLVASLDGTVEVFLFFPPASDAAEPVEQYFAELKDAGPLEVSRKDHALEPALARDLSVSGNGTVVFRKGGRKESLFIGTELEKARAQLRALDTEVQKRLLQVGRARRTVYLTAGHDERTRDPLGTTDRRATVDILWKTLQDQNFDVRPLSQAEGLGQEVPPDAAAVFIMGPRRAFTPPEAAAMDAYVRKGGRVFMALDPEAGLAFTELLGPLGLTMSTAPVAQERGTATLRPPPSPADRVNIGTRTFSSHPAVTVLNRATAAVLLLGAGALDEVSPRPGELTIDMAVKSLPDAWVDLDQDFQFDAAANETRRAAGLLAAVTRRPAAGGGEEARVLVLSDSDGIADEVLPLVPGNQYLVIDGLKWLLGDERLAGTTNTEVDVPLTRTRQQDSVWFYGTTFLAPLAVVGVGFLARRRTRPASPRKER